MRREPVPVDFWTRPPGSRSIGWDFAPVDRCFYCEGPILDFRCVQFRMRNGAFSVHEGECWDTFVGGVAAFNDRLLHKDVGPPN